MKSFKFSVVTTLLLVLGSCATGVTRGRDLELDQALSLRPGIQTKQEIFKMIGEPDKRVALKDGLEACIYFKDLGEGPMQRLSLTFDKKTEKLAGVVWIPMRGELLGGVKELLNHPSFKAGGFQRRETSIQKSHYIDHESYLEDRRSGISIHLGRNPKDVFTISFSVPETRRLAGSN